MPSPKSKVKKMKSQLGWAVVNKRSKRMWCSSRGYPMIFIDKLSAQFATDLEKETLTRVLIEEV